MTEDASTAGSILASQRIREKKRCLHCGTEFTAIRKSLYCGRKCRNAHWYYKNK